MWPCCTATTTKTEGKCRMCILSWEKSLPALQVQDEEEKCWNRNIHLGCRMWDVWKRKELVLFQTTINYNFDKNDTRTSWGICRTGVQQHQTTFIVEHFQISLTVCGSHVWRPLSDYVSLYRESCLDVLWTKYSIYYWFVQF